MANKQPSSQLPAALTELLDRLIARVRRLQGLRGVGLTVAAAITVILVAMAGDALFPSLPGVARLVWPMGILAVTGLTAWTTLVKPLGSPMSRERMARLVESRHPDFDEKLSTAIELGGRDAGSFSSTMLDEVVREAASFTGNVSPEAEFDPSRLRRVGALVAGPVLVLIILFLLWPGVIGRLLGRVLLPFADDASAFAAQVDVAPGNDVILRHTAWTLAADFSIELAEVPVWDVRQDDGAWLEERLQPLAEAGGDTERFGLRIPEVEESFAYRVRSGRIQSEVYEVTVVDPPMVTGLVTRVVFPTYAKRADLVLTNPVGVVMAVLGGTLEVEAQLNKPATEASLLAMKKAWPVDAPVGARSVSLTVAPKRAGESVLQWMLVDEHGFKGGSPPLGLRVLADRPPRIDLLRPLERELRMNPKDTLSAKALVEEDFGVAALDWMVALPGKPFESIEARMPLLREGRKTIYDSKPTLPLSTLDLTEAGSIRVRLRVTDNRPKALGGAQFGVTEVIEIIIDRSAERIADKMLKEQYEKAKQALKETEQAVRQAAQKMKQAGESAAKDQNEQQRQTRAERALEEAQAAEVQAAKAEAEVEDTTYSELAEKLAEIRREKLEEARQAAEQAALSEDPKEMEQAAKAAEKALEEAQEELSKLAVELGEKKKDVDRFLELNEQVADQASLAAEAQDAVEEGEAPTEDWEKRQDDLIGDVTDLIEENNADQAAFEAALTAARETLRDEAAELAKEQQAQADASQEAAETAASDEAKPSPPEGASALSEALAAHQEEVAESIREQAQEAASEAAAEKALDESLQESGQTDAEEKTPSPSAAAEEAAERAEALSDAADQAEAAADALREGDWEEAKEQARAAAQTLAEQGAPEEDAESAEGAEPGEESGSEPESESSSEGESSAGESGEEAGAESESEPGSEAVMEAVAATAELAEAQNAVADAIEAATAGQPEAAVGLGQEALSAETEALAEQGRALDDLAERAELPSAVEEGVWDQVAETGEAAEAAAEALADALSDAAASEGVEPLESGAESTTSESGEAGEIAEAAGSESAEGSSTSGDSAELTDALAEAQAASAEALVGAAEALGGAEAAGAAEDAEDAGATLPVVDPGLVLEALEAASKAQANAASSREAAAATPPSDQPPSSAPPGSPGQSSPPGSSPGKGSPGERSAEQAQQAATAMQDLADTMADRLGIKFPEQQSAQASSSLEAMQNGTVKGDASQEPGSEDSVPMQEGDLVLDDSPLGKATRDWEAFLGEARSGTAGSDYGNLSRDYQALVRRYFEAVARESSRDSEKGTEEERQR